MVLYIYHFEIIEDEQRFVKIGIIDNATSVIWVKRFNDVGEFEIYVKATPELFNMLGTLDSDQYAMQDEIFITRDESNVMMYVENVKLNTNDETGDYLTISGRSLECVMDWRVVSRRVYTSAETTAESIIRDVVNGFLIQRGNVQGALLWLQLGDDHEWPDYVTRQFTGKKVLEIVKELCISYNYGFEMVYEENPEDIKCITFNLYKGTDRSFTQNINPYVAFSPDFENLGDTEYTHDITNLVTGVLIGGEGEGASRTFVYVHPTTRNAFKRRYDYIDARNSSSDGMTTDEYKTMLQNQGQEYIDQHRTVTTFNGEILNYNNYTYGVDYNLGDKVSIVNAYGIKANATITEITEVEDENGYRVIPTFSEWVII